MTDYLSFPDKEMNFRTRISLRKYSRPKPGSRVEPTMDGVISLPLPVALQDSFNIEVANPALDLLGNDPSQMLTAGKTYTEEFQNMAKQGKFSVSQALELAARAAALAPGISDTGLGRAAQSIEGVVRNPHLTTIFEGVRLKVYQFTWKLSPQSVAEARKLNSIINTLKAYMHPQISGGGFSLDYPYLARVEFTNLQSALVPNVKDSFITGMQINGAGTGIPAFFKDGQPVTIDLSLSFQEINIQTREDFTGTSSSSQASLEFSTPPSRAFNSPSMG